MLFLVMWLKCLLRVKAINDDGKDDDDDEEVYEIHSNAFDAFDDKTENM